MLIQEALALAGESGENRKSVRLIRRKIHQLSIADMVEMFEVSAKNCKSVVDTIKAHPEWSDEQVAEEIYWED